MQPEHGEKSAARRLGRLCNIVLSLFAVIFFRACFTFVAFVYLTLFGLMLNDLLYHVYSSPMPKLIPYQFIVYMGMQFLLSILVTTTLSFSGKQKGRYFRTSYNPNVKWPVFTGSAYNKLTQVLNYLFDLFGLSNRKVQLILTISMALNLSIYVLGLVSFWPSVGIASAIIYAVVVTLISVVISRGCVGRDILNVPGVHDVMKYKGNKVAEEINIPIDAEAAYFKGALNLRRIFVPAGAELQR